MSSSTGTEVVLRSAAAAPPEQPEPRLTPIPAAEILRATPPPPPVIKTMETTDSHPVLATERDAVASGLRALRRALRAFGTRLSDTELAAARAVEQRAEQRLLLSATHTVVALAGATGSGKSSLFNALCGLELSAVGVRRPTTDTASACVWGPKGADDLLAWLGIPAGRQMARESALDADDQAELRGLVLLDLPDHDSTVAEHQGEVDRLVDRVDMLVWVVDPQKYADAAIHNRYLRALKGRDALVLVVLNHADTLSAEETESCVEDLRALLAADGLPQVRLVATSAVRGDGLAELRASLVEAVAARVASMRRLRADLDDMGARLAAHVGAPIHAEIERTEVAALQTDLQSAIGLEALVQQVGEGYRARAANWVSWPVTRAFSRLRPGAHTVATLDSHDEQAPATVNAAGPAAAAELVVAELTSPVATVQPAQVAEATRSLADRATVGLPEPWPQTVRTVANGSATDAATQLGAGVAHVPLTTTRTPSWWRAIGIAQWVIFGVLILGSLWLVVTSGAEAMGFDPVELPTAGRISIPSAVVLGSLVLGPLLALATRPFVNKGVRHSQREVSAALTDAVTRVSRDAILAPLRKELTSYEDARIAVAELRAGG